MDDDYFRLELGPLSEEVKEVARRELRETPEIREQALEDLKALLRNDENIYFGYDDDFLLIFLRPCKFYAESAYKLMVRIAKFKDDNKSIVNNLMPEDEKDCFCEFDVVNVWKERDQKGRRVLLFKCGGSWDPKRADADDLFRMFYLIHEIGILEPQTQVCGGVVIMDFDKLSMKQVTAITPSFCLRFLTFVQEALPLRLKEIHMVKQPFIFNLVWAMFKPFLKEKLKKRIFFHGNDMASLHKYISPSTLPEDYGGDKPKINYTCAKWYPNFDEHRKHILNMNEYGSVKK